MTSRRTGRAVFRRAPEFFRALFVLAIAVGMGKKTVDILLTGQQCTRRHGCVDWANNPWWLSFELLFTVLVAVSCAAVVGHFIYTLFKPPAGE